MSELTEKWPRPISNEPSVGQVYGDTNGIQFAVPDEHVSVVVQTKRDDDED